MDRRNFLRLGAAAAATPGLATLLAACGSDNTGSAATSASSGSTPATTLAPTSAAAQRAVRPLKIGFTALTDCAPLIMAKELGYFADAGLDVTLAKQASWPALRDALLNGEVQAAHCLYTMPFSVATKIGGPGTTDLKIAMILNNNGQAITLAKKYADVGYGDLAKAKALLDSDQAPELAMTFPGGTHDLWLRYWLRATGADATKLKISPVPPPQMVQNMTVGNVRGYCVGEPWNAVAVAKDIGFTHLATQDLWLHHPEKALVLNAAMAKGHRGRQRPRRRHAQGLRMARRTGQPGQDRNVHRHRGIR